MKKWLNKKKDKKERKELERKDKKEAKKLEKMIQNRIDKEVAGGSDERKEPKKELSPEELLMQKRIDEEVAGGNKFAELTFGYIRKHYNTIYGIREGEEKTEFIDMASPRPCSYNTTDSSGTWVRETIPIEAPPSHSTSSTLPVEYCGITTRQLRAVLANMERRCVAEGWTDRDGNLLTPDKVNLYHLNKYIIKPFTIKHKTSFVEALPSTAGPQLPRWFVSHWWGDPVRDSTACLDQVIIDFKRNYYNDDDDARGGGMSDDTPFWICAYANNQWDLGKDITKDPKESGFTRAMLVANNRTITILDKEGIVFSRVWCVFELFLTLVDLKGGVWGIYTAHTHTYTCGGKEERKAVGIISGGSTSDDSKSEVITAREAAFPYSLIKKSLSIKVESADASMEADRIHILNSIVGTSSEMIDDEPPTSHDKYVELNNSLRGTFASSAASLRGAADEAGEGWKEMLTAYSKGTMHGTIEFDFYSGGAWDYLTCSQATDLIEHLPLYGDKLIIQTAGLEDLEFVNGLIKRVKLFHNLKELNIPYTLVGGEEGGQEAGLHFAEMLSTNTTIEYLDLSRTDLITIENVEEWGDALMQNNAVKRMRLTWVEAEIVDQLRTKTENRTLYLDILTG